MAAYHELPSFVRPPGAANAPPRRRWMSPWAVIFGAVPAAIMLGLFLLIGGPSTSIQPSSKAAAAQSSSLSDMRVAAAIAAAAVLPQQRPMRADLPQGGTFEGQNAAKPAAVAQSADADADTDSSVSAEDSAAAEEAAETAALQLEGDGSKKYYSDEFEDIIAWDSAADAGTVQLEQPLPEDSSSSSSATSDNAATAEDADATAAEIWFGSSSNGGGSSSGDSALSPQDAEIAAILKAAAQGKQPADMAECLREKNVERPFSVEDFLRTQPARLKVEAQFNSRLPRAATAVTMFVAGTMDRKLVLEAQEMLAGLCESYGSVISLAVYVGVLAEDKLAAESQIAATVAAVKTEFDRLEAAGACQLDILVVSERLQNKAMAHLFPINALRNLALLNARTDLVMLGDMDLLAGADLKTVANNEAEYKELLGMTQNNKLVVVPAFESDSRATAQAAAAVGKAMAAALWKGTPNFRYFLQDGYEPAHQDTRFDMWVQTDEAYALNETDASFEPWFIGRRADISVYDARYRGYGKNKVQHLQMLKQLLGFKYVVHPHAFIVHRPHPPSTSKSQFEAELDAMDPAEAPAPDAAEIQLPATKNLNIFVTTEEWFGQQWRAAEGFRPLVTPGFKACRDLLPHWDVFGPGGEPIKTVTKIGPQK